MSQKDFKVVINFIGNKQVTFNNALVYFNADEEGDWVSLVDNSILGYDITLLKIVDLSNKLTKYIFAKNTNITVAKNIISIYTFSEFVFFIETKAKKQYNESYKEVSKKVAALEAMQQLGISIDQLLELNKLKEEKYILKMKNLHKLKEEE
ncbi:hypothetical protein FCM49_02485 [Mycoplasma bovis]|uniref:Uncharacterized protein n=1 Tax=Mycoplasmopsis bovis CQ-W70 TaxID=1316930 RepID=A0A059Y8P1_MYCBV|nr:hypothetical protein [Mycoplasmopsis bovis]AEI90186.1 conserved hypothetical protein [Mycoplasmopsis bovis Hubei-1]AFM51865.1 hypothetical protein Mbov_0511 [Mycoplasmopsis bovis HB0801]AIA34051.1 hypothetical protein K668_02365 [Mycoplasmopsis bovis CQ-W70]AKO50671.1 hypothetical protein AAV31_02495 [Mycoplasmopsis bovis]AQU85766.1 hypothetical protein B0W43_02570 [Mycoplasmopsis bovis]